MFRKQVLEMTSVQLEKRGLPSSGIEILILDLEISTLENEMQRWGKGELGRIGRRLINQWDESKLKAVNTYWRQP